MGISQMDKAVASGAEVLSRALSLWRGSSPFLCSRQDVSEVSKLRLSVLRVVEQFGSVPSKISYLFSNFACLPKFLFALGNPLQLLG